MGGSAPERDSWWIAVGLLAAAALTLRTIGAMESPAGDELILYTYLKGHSLGEVMSSVTTKEKTPPLGFILSWLTAHLGPTENWMRAPSVIAGTVLVALTAMLGRRTAGAFAGLSAAAFAAVSPFLLYYGVEARSYSLAACLACAGTLLLLSACERGGRWRWAGFAVVSCAALMSHYTTVFVIGAGILWALVARPKARRELVLSIGAIAILSAAWIPSLVTQWGNSADEARRIAFLAPLSASTLGEVVSRALIGHPLWSSLRTIDLRLVPGTIGLVLIAAGFGGAVAVGLWRWASQGRSLKPPRAETVLLVMLAVAAPAGLILFSLQPHKSLLLPRNAISSVPAALVLVAIPVARARRPLNLIAALLITGGLLIGSIRELVLYGRPAMKPAAAAISRDWKQGDPILEAIWFSGPPTDLSIYLTAEQRRDLRLTHDVGLKPFFESLATGRPIFTVSPASTLIPGVLGPPGILNDRFHLAWSRKWDGMLDVTAAEWIPNESSQRAK